MINLQFFVFIKVKMSMHNVWSSMNAKLILKYIIISKIIYINLIISYNLFCLINFVNNTKFIRK